MSNKPTGAILIGCISTGGYDRSAGIVGFSTLNLPKYTCFEIISRLDNSKYNSHEAGSVDGDWHC